MSAKKVESIEAERRAIRIKLEFIKLQVSAHDRSPLHVMTVDGYMKEVDYWRKKLDDSHVTLCELKPSDFEDHNIDYVSLLVIARQAQHLLWDVKASFPINAPIPAAPEAIASSQSARLPKLEIQPFHGNYLEWPAFKDTFEASIHKNPRLPKVEKFSYLKSLLKGEASRFTQSLALTEANYDQAWQQLHDRYQNKRKITMATIESLFAQPHTNRTPKSIKGLIDTTTGCLRTMELQGFVANNFVEAILVHQIIAKLDPESKNLYEHTVKDKEVPKLKELFDFLECHATALEESSSTQASRSYRPERRAEVHHTQTRQQGRPQARTIPCKVEGCQETHPLYRCKKFLDATVAGRRNIARLINCCFSCFLVGHAARNCTSQFRCRKCQSTMHNTLLHFDAEPRQGGSGGRGAGQTLHTTVRNRSEGVPEQNAEVYPLLATARVRVEDNYGKLIECRVLLDNASSSNFITSACARKLNLKKRKTYVPVSGLGETAVANATGITNLAFCPHFDNSKKYWMESLIVPSISRNIPEQVVNTENMNFLNDLQLADPDFHLPAGIDILIGAELFWEIVDGTKKSDLAEQPLAIKSTLGWLVGGGKSAHPHTSSNHYANESVTPDAMENSCPAARLDELMNKFWEVETVPMSSTLSAEENQCEEHFEESYSRDLNGRFIVRYPFKANPSSELGDSLAMAMRRFAQVERRLQKNAEYYLEYKQFMAEYAELGHMIEVEPPSAVSKFRYYIPHHFVLKESSTTTKFRVVFDASAKTSNGVSLNDLMLIGPSIQDSLANLIMRFRKHKVAINADIAKMYRQVWVHSDDAELQHIVWRNEPSSPFKHYKLLTLTYGTATAPYLATKVLQRLAEIEEKNFPLAAKILTDDFYMDDVMSGADTEENAILLQQQLIQLLLKGGFSIRKFTSNSEAVLQSLPEDLRETKSLLLDKESGVKTLGIFWNPRGDYFGFHPQYASTPAEMKLTKRNLLSEISQLFDPIGWLSPVVIKSKILMQSIWKENLNWDEIVPDRIRMKWEQYKAELSELQHLKLPRAQVCSSDSTYLVGFSDASEEAYSASVYICSYNEEGKGCTSLVSSKTRVAPVKKLTLPRLELCGALLLAEFMPQVADALKLNYKDILAFTDSTLVLRWVRSESYKFKTFVGNRISKIQERIPPDKSGFVRGVDNPADCASRGIGVQDLLNHPLWWTGPGWLSENIPEPRFPTDWIAATPEEERKAIACHKTTTHSPQDLFTRYSTWTRLQRVTAYIFRFANNAKAAIQGKEGLPAERCTENWLTTNELHAATAKLVSIAQEEEYSSEIKDLRLKKMVDKRSKILSLAPFLDDRNILRVGGRLRHANIPSHQKHPILLPQHHQLTAMIIKHAHLSNLHAGAQTLLSYLQQRFWIIRGKDAVRKEVRKCIKCTRFRAESMQQIMADLPSFRVNPSHPFQNCGIDYGGPFLIKPITPRSKITIKAYICIFVCCATRAIHLEVVSAATTEAFLAALRRFIARRGKPGHIYSDNGTNFVGANKEIKEFVKLTNSDKHNDEVAILMSTEGIKWHYQPPSAPHFGGHFEAGIKSTKYHLKRVMGLNRLTFEELSTLTAQIEAILNSRPVTPESTNPSDVRALTPGHFLIGQPLTTIPDPEIIQIPTNRLVRWQLIQQMVQNFWKRWSSEYITRLQQRSKWMIPQESIKIGSLVIIKEDNLPPLKWKLGRVTTLHAGDDGHVRAVTLRTDTGEMKRPIVKLCLLAVENEPTTNQE